MKFSIKHYDGGFQVIEKSGEDEILIASFHKSDVTKTGAKSEAQLRAEEYCDFLNQKDAEGDLFADLTESS